VATFKPHHGKVLGVTKGLDRDRAVDESGHQIGVFGRVGARPMNAKEQAKLYLRNGMPWFVNDDPKSPLYRDKTIATVQQKLPSVKPVQAPPKPVQAPPKPIQAPIEPLAPKTLPPVEPLNPKK
jgi:hypothetical protein